ncbi:MFS transporter [Cytophaga aurantiaca]|uniref:MFS transporter n=1 Tax=Cytophaga aurantiaca TaxID=29530 RepID=UPI0003600920|nr:MFS transporter [Cytophaga aurantiaca]
MEKTINPNKLFLASCIAIIATAMTFAIRASLEKEYCELFSLSHEKIGYVLGTAFWGFTLSIIFGGFLCDLIGMKRLIVVAFGGHVLGIALTILATGFWSLFFSTLLIGIANGMVEAVCNPLVSTLYKDDKTTKLNRLHVWFPGGIVIGGLIAFFFKEWNLSKEFQLATILIPTAANGLLFFNEKFPATERVDAGVSFKQMFQACTQPLFLVMLFCMLLTASTEFGTNQWISNFLSSLGVKDILLLVYINLLMAFGRTFAGGFVHRLSPIGMLIFSAVFSAIGLFLFNYVDGYWAFLPATIFAFGICFFWPTMLGFVSENLPKTGALGISLMGGAGMLSVSFVLPFMGMLYDSKTLMHMPKGYTVETLHKIGKNHPDIELLNAAQLDAGIETLQLVAILPVILTVVFVGIYLVKKKRSN